MGIRVDLMVKSHADRTVSVTFDGDHLSVVGTKHKGNLVLVPQAELPLSLLAMFTLAQWAENYQAAQDGRPLPHAVTGTVTVDDRNDNGVTPGRSPWLAPRSNELDGTGVGLDVHARSVRSDPRRRYEQQRTLRRSISRPAQPLPPNSASCGNQPAHISMDHVSNNDTRAARHRPPPHDQCRRQRPMSRTPTPPALLTDRPTYQCRIRSRSPGQGDDGCVERLIPTRLWGEDDLTGGPLDVLLQRVRASVPDLIVERLVVVHPGDDDNVYLLGNASGRDLVQVNTYPDGQPTFFIEASDRAEAADVTTAAGAIVRAVESGRVRPSDDTA